MFEKPFNSSCASLPPLISRTLEHLPSGCWGPTVATQRCLLTLSFTAGCKEPKKTHLPRKPEEAQIPEEGALPTLIHPR